MSGALETSSAPSLTAETSALEAAAAFTQAVYIPKATKLKAVEGRAFEVLYFGQEFCERLIPALEEVKEVVAWCKARGVGLVYLTPYVTDKYLKKLRTHFDYLSAEMPEAEIGFNDYGVMSLLHREHPSHKLELGRLLNKIKRGPMILKMKDLLPEPAYRHFQTSPVSVFWLRKFYADRGVTRVAFDNVIQGIRDDLNYDDAPLKGSIFYPFVYVTTSRSCATATYEAATPRTGVFPCQFQCQKYTFRLEHESYPVPLTLKGNSQFFVNEAPVSHLARQGFDRFVYMPEIPI